MVKRVLLVGLLGMSLVALFGNEASARICTLRSATGACLVWTGSIECGISATGIGNVTDDRVLLACTATGNGEWVVACGNPGSNNWTAPGVNVVNYAGTLTASYQLTPADIDHNGRAYVNVFAPPGIDLLEDLTQQGACPNLNWSAIDAVPCNMTLIDQQLDATGCVTAEALFNCSLPECETLGWDAAAQKFERRQYQCTQISTSSFKCP